MKGPDSSRKVSKGPESPERSLKINSYERFSKVLKGPNMVVDMSLFRC